MGGVDLEAMFRGVDADLAEERLGRALEGRRDEVVLATKCCRYDVRGFDFSAKRVHQDIDDCLRRLRTDAPVRAAYVQLTKPLLAEYSRGRRWFDKAPCAVLLAAGRRPQPPSGGTRSCAPPPTAAAPAGAAPSPPAGARAILLPRPRPRRPP